MRGSDKKEPAQTRIPWKSLNGDPVLIQNSQSNPPHWRIRFPGESEDVFRIRSRNNTNLSTTDPAMKKARRSSCFKEDGCLRL